MAAKSVTKLNRDLNEGLTTFDQVCHEERAKCATRDGRSSAKGRGSLIPPPVLGQRAWRNGRPAESFI